MEISVVRRRLQAAMASARERARRHRASVDEAEREYAVFLDRVAVPLARQLANALRAEGLFFTVSTPARGLRLSSDHARDDFVELALQTGSEPPQVVGSIRRTRGSRIVDEERPIKAGVPPQDLTEDDVLEFFVQALEPWLE